MVAASSLWWSVPTAPATAPDSRLGPDPTAGPGRNLDAAELLECIELASRRCAVAPVYDEKSLGWLLEHLEGADHRGTLHRRVVTDRDGDRVGWYVYYTNADGYNGVRQLGAFGGAAPLVLADLLRHASLAGGSAVTRGRLDPAFADAVQGPGSSLVLGPWTLAHSPDRELLLALTSGRGSRSSTVSPTRR